MEACIENTGVVAGVAAPSWAIRVARPVGNGFRMAEELRGVPASALQSVFGRALGRRIWRQELSSAADVPVELGAGRVSDAEIALGMVGYLCKQAVSTLRERQRLANGVTLTVLYTDGESKVAQGRLPRLTDALREIDVMVRRLLDQMPRDGVRSIHLRISGVEVGVARERATKASLSTASLHA
ncbi:MAG: hypothetical protein WA715_25530 [Candidatus Acidiferrum sp.]